MQQDIRLNRTRRPVFAGIALALAMLGATGSAARADFPQAAQFYDAGDYAAAAAIWHDLASHCDAPAQTALAGLYRAGLGVPKSDVEAMRWYLMAAWAGERFAQQVVGDLYERGDVLPADRVRATFWLTLAARQGLDWAAARRDAVELTLDPVERDAVAGRLDGFAPAADAMCKGAR